ncbi:MAG TPA: LuxR C-terminal-related transcriptional regulator [Spirochaetota bacterium]|nr:LuxR C-terminal-related transcriptional regulator [Spirochaetota bacterium]
MNILITAYIASAFIGFESALFVYRLNRLSITNRIYAAFAFSHSLFSIVMIQFILSPDRQACFFWYRIFTFIACVCVILRLHYFMELAGIKAARTRPFIAVMYSLPLIVALPIMTFHPVVADFVRFSWGWGLVVIRSVWTLLFYSYMMGSGLVCTALAVYWRFRAGTQREKKQADIIILSSMAGIIALAHLFFPADHVISGHALFINLYNILCFVILVFGIRFAVMKYGLMTLTPTNPASELFERMYESLFVINTRGDIIFLNENARILSRHAGMETGTGSIFGLFESPGILRHEIEKMVRGRELMQPLILAPSGNAGGKALETTLLGVKNETGEIVGIIAILREAGGITGLQEQLNLSPREIEVLLMLCGGMSSREIAEECEITLLTVKTHIHNIYQKTGLKNRVELSNLLNRHF